MVARDGVAAGTGVAVVIEDADVAAVVATDWGELTDHT